MSQPGPVSRFMGSPAFKFVLLGLLTLLLMIPMLMVYLVVDERERYSRAAVSEVGRKWGLAQKISGPYLIVPQTRWVEKTDRAGVKTRSREVQYVTLLPETLNVEVDVSAKELKRGIYGVPVYESKFKYSGRFNALETEKLTRGSTELRFEDAAFVMLISDVRGIKETTSVQLGAQSVKFTAGNGFSAKRAAGIHVSLQEHNVKSGFEFSFELPVNGTETLHFEPSGGETKLQMKSNWPHPSFIGNFLPSDRSISSKGFEARWDVPQLARGQSQLHIRPGVEALMRHNLFGVQFYQPVGFYDLVGRALKYAIAFIAAAFLLVFVMEVYAGRPVHWIQYVFVGFALLIFYLVLLGLAEHIGFELSFGLASFATSALIGLYSMSALKSPKKGFVLGFILLLIYGLLYLLLRVEDYALLIGSLTAFFMLAIVMYITRDVDWSGYRSPAQKE